MRIKLCEPAARGKEKSAWVISVSLPLGITLGKIAKCLSGEKGKKKRCPEVQIKKKKKKKRQQKM